MQSQNGFILSHIMRDFKKYSKKIIQTITVQRSQVVWLLALFFKSVCAFQRDQSSKTDITLK
jgi:hypothetical protein